MKKEQENMDRRVKDLSDCEEINEKLLILWLKSDHYIDINPFTEYDFNIKYHRNLKVTRKNFTFLENSEHFLEFLFCLPEVVFL